MAICKIYDSSIYIIYGCMQFNKACLRTCIYYYDVGVGCCIVEKGKTKPWRVYLLAFFSAFEVLLDRAAAIQMMCSFW